MSNNPLWQQQQQQMKRLQEQQRQQQQAAQQRAKMAAWQQQQQAKSSPVAATPAATPLPADVALFAAKEQVAQNWRDQYAAGALTQPELDSRLRGELLEYAGTWWMPSRQERGWLRLEGKQWVPAVPPGMRAAAAPVVPIPRRQQPAGGGAAAASSAQPVAPTARHWMAAFRSFVAGLFMTVVFTYMAGVGVDNLTNDNSLASFAAMAGLVIGLLFTARAVKRAFRR